jgi:tetratricopeptide (TPR) repeat protein
MLNQKDALQFKAAKQLYNKGQQLFLKKSFKKAEKSFLECLKKFPKFSRADYYLSQIYYDRGDLLKALDNIRKAKENYKFVAELDVATQLEYLSMLREQKRNLEAELRDMQDIATRGGMTTSKSRELEARMVSHKNSIRKIDDRLKVPLVEAKGIPAGYYYVHGNILFKLKKFKEALDMYFKTVEIDPQHGSAYNNIANLFYMGRKYQQALFYLSKAEGCGIKVNPKFREAIEQKLNN